ncbi:MAG: tripartite tricarboxylate transporter TctB family protein [Zoogloeaceae bacterium]|nr:tripartite tricarboxylate transporter TctB family protein [Zoogloeaceae bacterium]
MSLSLFKHQDVVAGLLFCLTGLVVAAVSVHQYPLGSAMRMGAGYFPLLLGGFLAILGGTVLLRAIFSRRRHFIGRLMFKPVLLIGAGVLAFAGLLGSIGLAAATLALIALSGSAHHESRLRELLPLGLAMALFGAGVFVWGLGLPLSLLPA